MSMGRENATEHHNKYNSACEEIKELKEKITGNMSLIRARKIIWNDIIQKIKVLWDHMVVIVEEKEMIRASKAIIYTNKTQPQESSQLEKRIIDYLNAKSS